MKKTTILSERYSKELMGFLKYMKQPIDHYVVWEYFADWFENNYADDDDAIEWLDVATDGMVSSEGVEPALDEIRYNQNPELFDTLPDYIQNDFKGDISELITRKLQDDPVNTDTRAYMTLNDMKPLNRNTWLVHFTEYADYIAVEGFTRAVTNVDKLGLTKQGLSDYEYSDDGYSFAFEAASRDAIYVAHDEKYGDECVVFQNSGVSAWHNGDDENQVIFHSKDVDPKNIIRMKKVDGDWVVLPHPKKENRYGRHDLDGGLIAGSYEKMIEWIKTNNRQYSKALFENTKLEENGNTMRDLMRLCETHELSVGDSWVYKENPVVKKTIVGIEQRNGQDIYLVQVDGERSADLLSAEMVMKMREVDAANLITRRETNKKEQMQMMRQLEQERERNDVDGFDAGMSALQRGKVLSALNTKVMYHNIPISRRDLIRKKVKDGAYIDSVANKPVLMMPDDTFLPQAALTKIGMDYARYLMSMTNTDQSSISDDIISDMEIDALFGK